MTFFIAFFVLVMQNLWKYIDDLVGKGLGFITILEFLWYAGATLLMLSMPIAILISSIMTFGNLGENFELVAIKSSGISLLRFMRPLIWVSVLLCFITFLFANYVIPYANLKFKTLYADIRFKKPALDLREGRFYTALNGYAIKIGKKDADNKTIHDVVIYDQHNWIQDNCIIAEKGTMSVSEDKNYLEFVLQNGTRYQEQGNTPDTSTEFIAMSFKEYKKLFDLSSLQMANTPDSVFKNDSKMLSVRQLSQMIDSLKKADIKLKTVLNSQSNNILRTSFSIPDSTWKKTPASKTTLKNFNEEIPDSARSAVFNNAGFMASNFKNTLQFSAEQSKSKSEELRDNKIEFQRKFSLSLACLVLFFIGAPLGSIIRKGGFGMPLVLAILFFLVFHLLNMFGEKFAQGGITSIFIGMWLSVICLIPVGFFFTYKAMHDSQLFNKEFYYRTFKKIRPFIMPIVNKVIRKNTGEGPKLAS